MRLLTVSSLIPPVFMMSIAFFACIMDLALGRAGLMPVQPTYLALSMTVGFVVIDFLLSTYSSATQSGKVRMIRRHLLPISLYGTVAVTAIFYGFLPNALWGDGGKWILLIALGYVLWMGTLFLCGDARILRSGERGIVLASLLLSTSVIYEVFAPGTFSNLVARASGFAGNANFGALATTMLCAAALRYSDSNSILRDGLLLMLALLAVLATQSRSGLLELLVLVLVWGCYALLSMRRSPRQFIKAVLSLGATVVLAAGALFVVVQQGALFSEEGSRFSRILSGRDVDDGSGDERMDAAADTLAFIARAPITGYGTGFSRTLQTFPHNIYLQQWVNNGLLGLVTYLGFVFSCLGLFVARRYPPGIAFMCVTVVGGCFSHNILDQKSFILPLAVLLAASTRTEAISERAPYTSQ